MNEYVIRDSENNVVTVVPLRNAWRYLKTYCLDGEYSIEGPNTDCTVILRDKTVYPSSGILLGEPIGTGGEFI